MVIKLLMNVGLHDVYPAMEVNFLFRRKVKMIAICNFASLGEEILIKLLFKKGKKTRRKEKRKVIDHMIGQKRREMFALCRSVAWRC